ncbi:glycoside hydrolase family 114 protein, partial [Piromyces sp. E2]
MKFTLPITLIASALLAINVEARWKPTPGLTWDYLLGASDSVIKASDKQVVTIDLDEAEKYVPYFHNRNQRVICYFSGGTMQKSRKSDYNDYKNANVGIKGSESPWGNEIIDVRKKSKLQPLIRNRMQKAHKYGCDAVEVDSLDIYGFNVGISKNDCFVFAKWVAETGHEEDMSVGLKNVQAIAADLVDDFDFAVVESCAEYNECKIYSGFTKRNKAVFMVHYENRGHQLSGSSLKNLIKNQAGQGFTCVLSKNRDLNHNCTNYDCDTGAIRDSGNKTKIETSKKTSITYIKKTTTTTTTTKKRTTTKIIITQNAVNINTKTIPKPVSKSIYVNTKTIPRSIYTNNAVAPKSIYTTNKVATKSIYTKKTITTKSIYTTNKIATKSIYTKKSITTKSVYTKKPVTIKSIYTKKLVTTKSIYTKKPITSKS